MTVFAAPSLKNALDPVAERCPASAGGAVTISYAASPALARQIEQGAPAGLFITFVSAMPGEIRTVPAAIFGTCKRPTAKRAR